MEAAKERRERLAADEGDAVQLPTETSPYVRYEGLEDYKMRGYGAQGHLPVSDVPHGGSGTDAPTVPGTAVPVARPERRIEVQAQRELGAGKDDAGRRGDASTDVINRQGVP
ncbi:hypothetical protein PAHAL_2G309400 [Panicum hallii]|jgi:hypothetical protein|uniref:Uncharacterized protein n=1 Tax=Panicum hallii TaxID=206008 RepID=A0A2S3H0Q4_9POAL|nr:uncharacterized protein LOC112882316 [Panicum hallii]PAN13037.1 hypothetical protein PAHAL_2G309400 [Panicum hallii]